MTDRAEHNRTGVRAAVQAVCLGTFVCLAVAAQLRWPSPLPYDLFLRVDPLVWLTVSTAAREVAVHVFFALGLVVVTALLGRVFCGWVCPLGSAQDAVRSLRRRRSGGLLVQGLSSVRYGVLIVLLGSAALGANLAGWLDPVVMSTRALHGGAGAGAPWTAALFAWAPIGAVLGLVFVAPRFWCRTLCPLGAVLSLIARPAVYRRHTTASCTQCGTCADVCPMGRSRVTHAPVTCIGCRRCEAACPENAATFTLTAPSIRGDPRLEGERPTGPRRRRFMLGVASLAVGGVVGTILRARSRRTLLRPPGAQNERQVAERCVGCGTCQAVCPTGGLVPLLSAARLDALFSPVLVPRIGPCLPDCTSCGDACPTGAIPAVTAHAKAALRIGIAVIDRARCLPWACGQRCVICLDACPADYDAIELRQVETGEFRPYVKERQCTGCGICEYKCPVEGKSAIRVIAVKEMIGAT